jgi:hypothetical protein
MYTASPLFRKAYSYCAANGFTIMILSAKYGLISPDTEIEDYDETLNTQSHQRVLQWSRQVSTAIRQIIPVGSSIELHAGRNYIRHLDLAGYDVRDPLQGLTVGRRLGWYTKRGF